MLRKGLAVVVILLFFGMCVVPSTAVQELKEKPFPISFDGNTLYVGGTGPNNYTSIQSAINDAVDGDTVFVYTGVYYENIIINKSITLHGEEKNATGIDGNSSENIVSILKDFVNLNNFSISCYSEYGSAGVYFQSNFCIISNNNFFCTNLSRGIKIGPKSNNNIVSKNFIHDCSSIGIAFDSNCSNNEISYNIIYDGNVGIDFDGYLYPLLPSNNNYIFSNEIVNCSAGIHFEVSCNNNIISNNILYDIREGISIVLSFNNIISNNYISSGRFTGISLGFSRFNRITQNTITNSSYGIVLGWSSFRNTVTENLISDNSKYGIYMDRSSGVFIRNTFLNNSENVFFNSVGIHCINRWRNNYWGVSFVAPKIIKGTLSFLPIIDPGPWNSKSGYIFSIPWFNIDWRPAREPYDIGV